MIHWEPEGHLKGPFPKVSCTTLTKVPIPPFVCPIVKSRAPKVNEAARGGTRGDPIGTHGRRYPEDVVGFHVVVHDLCTLQQCQGLTNFAGGRPEDSLDGGGTCRAPTGPS